jgi:hypothetical protein
MRNLLYIPMIHVDSDLGSVAASVNRKSVEICGKERWLRHKRIVATFWERIRDYFNGLDAQGLMIYQDGLMADGDLGRKIIEAGAKRGSPNHQIVLNLIERGARIRKTEDVDLLKKEFNRILQIAEAGPESGVDVSMEHRAEGDRLMAERDQFIATTINQTLKEEERGALFIGAFHNVLPHLHDTIQVTELKNHERVKAYFKCVISGGDEESFNFLARYMISECSVNVEGPTSMVAEHLSIPPNDHRMTTE